MEIDITLEEGKIILTLGDTRLVCRTHTPEGEPFLYTTPRYGSKGLEHQIDFRNWTVDIKDGEKWRTLLRDPTYRMGHQGYIGAMPVVIFKLINRFYNKVRSE